MLHARIDEHEFVALRVKREVLKLTATAVQTHQFACLTEDGGELIHDTAVAAYILMLGSLPRKNHVPLTNRAAELLIQAKSKTALQRSG